MTGHFCICVFCPKWDRGPKIFPLGVCPPPTVPNFGLLRKGIVEGEFFENSQACDLALQDQNGNVPPGKLVSGGGGDIDVVLAPYCLQMVRNPKMGVYFSISAPNSPGGASKVDPSLLPVSADFVTRVQPRSDCHRSDCPRPTPTTQSV